MKSKNIRKNNKIKLIVIVAAAALALAISTLFVSKSATGKEYLVEMVLLHSPTCPHCIKAMAFLDKIEPKYPEVEFSRYDVSTKSGGNYYVHYMKKLKWEGAGVPVAVFGDEYVLGYGDDATTGKQYTDLIDEMLKAKRAEKK